MKKSRIVILVILAIITSALLLLPNYAIRALWYQLPGIEDYQIFHNNTIAAGEYEAWETADNYNKQTISETNYDRIMSYDPVAFLVVQNEEILYEEYWDGYDENSLSNSFSMAKSIVSLLIGAALDEGLIKSLDQKVGDFIPSFKDGNKSKISIRHLLTMSAGTNWNESYSSLFSPTTESYYGTDLEGMVNNLMAVKEPGKQYYYASIETEVLAMVVQSATGKSISKYTSEKYWQWMGAEHDALWCLDKENGIEKAYCCFNSNVRDFARWGQLILNKGKWNGKQLVSEAYISEATAPATYLLDEEGEPLTFYGFQWWIIDYKGYQIPYMRGILGQYVFVIKEKNAVVVRLGHERSDELIGPNRKDIFVYLDAAFEILK